LIARAEQCSFGLTRKLEKRGFDSACVSAVITRLLELKLVDDRRFAQLWLASRLRPARSPRRLLSSLQSRGIDRDDAESALKTALDEETEFALLERFAKRLSKKAERKGKEGINSIKFMLRNEGFSMQAIKQYLGEE
jgi:regulatory protein